MRKLKTVQIGIGHDHALPTFNSTKKQSDIFDFVGIVVCDGEEKLWDERADMYAGVPRLSLEEALAIKDLDAVTVECEDFDLTRYAGIFAERGVHIHMDKPGGIEQADYEQMLSVMKKKGLVFQTGYMYRYNPVVEKLLKSARAGELGEIYAVEAHMDCIHQKEKRAWLGDYPGGMMYFLGCHLVDLIVQFAGVPDEVQALNMPTGFDGVDACDYGMAVFKYKNGISFAKTCAAEPGGFMRRQLVVCGSLGTCEIKPLEEFVDGSSDLLTRWVQRTAEGGWGTKFPEHCTEPYDRYDTMLRHFAEYITGERENPYSYEYEARLHRIVLAACGRDIDYKAEIKL